MANFSCLVIGATVVSHLSHRVTNLGTAHQLHSNFKGVRPLPESVSETFRNNHHGPLYGQVTPSFILNSAAQFIYLTLVAKVEVKLLP